MVNKNAFPNFKGNIVKSQWVNTPTTALRVPEKFKDEIIEFAKRLDCEVGPISWSVPTTHADAIEMLKGLSLADLLKIELHLPSLIEEKKREGQNQDIERAIAYLADRCDKAHALDGAGFNAADAGFGHWLASRVRGNHQLIKSHAQAALKMLQKYKRQLAGGDITLPAWEAVEHQYPNTAKPQIVPGVELPVRRVEIKRDEVLVFAPYDATGKFQKDAKSIPNYRFNGEDKSWRYPLIQAPEIKEKFPEFHFSEEFLGTVALAEMEREEKRLEKEAEAAATANEIIGLIAAAQLDAPLSNGWYLREYQKAGAEWLLAHRKGGLFQGGILADQMGLGKTLTTLVAARGMQNTYKCPIFVICPVSLIENWRREAEKVGVNIEIFSWSSIPQPLDNQQFLLICDEAHYAQNLKSQRTVKMLELAQHKNCLAAWMLTGTPIKNGRPVNLFPLLLATGHPLANDKLGFEKRYCAAFADYVKGRTIWDNTGAAHLDELSAKTEDIILRRTKGDCLKELPAKTRLFETVELDGEKSKEYSQMVSLMAEDYRLRSESAAYRRNLPLLFKCSSDPVWLAWVLAYNPVDKNAEALATLNYLRKAGSYFKADAAVELAQDLLEQGQQVVIFTEFLESAELIASQLDALLLTGETKPEDRMKLVDKFQSGEKKVFVGTIKAGGVGLTLIAASHVILVDRAWTPGDCEQAEDRCHRIGQQSAVFATWLQLGLVDTAIDDLIRTKSDRIELILKGKRRTLKGLASPADLAKELLAML